MAIAAGVIGRAALTAGIIGGTLSQLSKRKRREMQHDASVGVFENCQTALVFTEVAMVVVVSAIIKGICSNTKAMAVVAEPCKHRKGDASRTRRRRQTQKSPNMIRQANEVEGLLNVENLLNTAKE